MLSNYSKCKTCHTAGNRQILANLLIFIIYMICLEQAQQISIHPTKLCLDIGKLISINSSCATTAVSLHLTTNKVCSRSHGFYADM